ncbi:MAG: PAS domain-containing protein [Myxococcales bacterium]|nr:PAS domain-containing protein [Myxococcales bacterium]
MGRDDRLGDSQRGMRLEQRETLLADIEQHIALGTWVWHADDDSVYWSDELFRLLGYDPAVDEASIEAYWARVHPDDLELVKSTWSDYLKGGPTEQKEHRLLLPSGDVRYVQPYGHATLTNDGQLHKAVGSVRDVSAERERLRALRLLRGVEAAYAEIGLIEGSVNASERWWSPSTYRLFGLEDGEVEPSPESMARFVHPDDQPALFSARATLAQSKSGQLTIDFRVLPKSGGLRYCRGVASMVDGDKLHVVVIDITEQHALRERLASAEQLEAVGRLAGSVAHDINNLMMVVNTIAGEVGITNPEAAEMLGETVRRASGLARGLLAVGGGGKYHMRATSLRELALGVARRLEAMVGQHGNIIVDASGLSEDTPAIMADSERLEQALLNVATNARDALRDVSDQRPGTITFSSRPIGASIAQLVISDDGPGMAPDVLARAFEPFFTTKTVGGGSGLGLALARATVERHGGTLTVDSHRGEGTRVTFELPATDAEALATLDQSPRQQPRDLRAPVARRVLVVDDDDMVRGALCNVLRRLGYSVYEASLPSRAMSMAREHKGTLDALICDLVMPEMLGPALVARLREDGLCPARVVFVTGYAGSAEAMLVPEDTVLYKPFSMAQLSDALAHED